MQEEHKYFKLTLTISNIKPKHCHELWEFYDDVVNELVNRETFFHTGFVFNDKSLTITTEYFQSNLKAIFMKILKDRVDILKESYPLLQISFKIEEAEPKFDKNKNYIIDGF